MKLVSWNVNGIRASVKKGFEKIVQDFDADIFCIQETKAQDNQVSEALKGISDYELFTNSAEFNSKRTWALQSMTWKVVSPILNLRIFIWSTCTFLIVEMD